MLRFLGIYPFAILMALAITTFVNKHGPLRMPGSFATSPPENFAAVATPAATPNFGPEYQDIPGDWTGHYMAPVQIENRDLHMLIDTGATFLSLTNEDAEELGIRPPRSEFTLRMQTANGVSLAAYTWLPHVRVGNVEVPDVQAIVMAPGASRVSLLGMSFLRKLRRYGVANGQMRLEQ